MKILDRYGRQVTNRLHMTAEGDNGALIVDGAYFAEWARSKKMSGCRAYCIDKQAQDAAIDAMENGDFVSGSVGVIRSINFRTNGGGIFKIFAPDSFIGGNGGDYARKINEASINCGITDKWVETGGGIAAKIMGEYSGGYKAPKKWRALAHSAIASGPMVHHSGGAKNGLHLDINAAYLHSMTGKFPTKFGAWVECDSDDGWLFFTGFVFVPQTDGATVLPIKTVTGRILYPFGTLEGTWSRDNLELAISLGASVIHGRYVRHTYTAPIFEGIADHLWKVKQLGGIEGNAAKTAYTRLWGVASSMGNSVGDKIGITALPEGSTRLGGKGSAYLGNRGGIFWHVPTDDMRMIKAEQSGCYAPDISAIISCNNHSRVMRDIAKFGDSVIASHVDSLFLDLDYGLGSPDIGQGLGEYSIVGRGEIRYYRQGVYVTDWKVGKMGLDCEDSEVGKKAQATSENLVTHKRRVWNISPLKSIAAVSWPPYISARTCKIDPLVYADNGAIWAIDERDFERLSASAITELRDSAAIERGKDCEEN